MRPLQALSALVLTALCPLAAQGQSTPLSADRPGFSNGTTVVRPSHMVFELGLSSSPFSSSHATAAPELSMRLGINRWLELRWQAPNVVFQGVRGESGKSVKVSLSNPSIGFKVARSLGSKVQASSVTQVSIPVGTPPAGTSRAQYYLDFNLSWQALSSLSIVPNAVLATQPSDDPTLGGQGLQGALSFALNWSPTNQLTTYLQSVAWFQKPYQKNLLLGGGIAYLIGPDAQLDLYVDIPVLSPARNLVIGLGTSRRW